MFEFIRQHTRVLFFVLIVLIIPSFVFFGIEGYTSFRNERATTVAHVGAIEISQAEWDAAHRENIERVRRQSPNVDIALLDTPAMRSQTLDDLVRQRLMLLAADKLHLVTGDERMLRLFRQDPQFAFLRNPDGSVNKDILAAQGLSSEGFAQRLRQDISSRQVLEGVEASAFAPAAAASAALDAFLQQREIQVQRFDAAAFASQVKPTEAQIEAYYKDPAHAAGFRAPEQVDIEYVVLDLDALAKGVKLDEEALRRFYTENEARYTTPEERRASHILIKAEAGAPAAEQDKAKARAEELLAELRRNPSSFAELARKNSQDPGSAAKGGDLDFFGRGAMVKPFEEAAFALKPGAISDVVRSDFGYHIIQLNAVRGGDKRSFESVRPEIEAQVRREQAQKRYAEIAAEFGNTVYEQPDGLKPVAERYGLELRTAKGLGRTPAPGATGPLASPKFLEQVFSGDAISSKRNTDAVETGSQQMAAARVLQHQPARQRPLAEVRDLVTAALVQQQAAALARKAGEERLAALKAAPADLPGPRVTVSRLKPADGIAPAVVDAALRAPAQPLPSLVGVDLGGQGYAIVRVTQVLGRDPAAGDPANARSQFGRALGEAESEAYVEALKRRFKARREGAGAAPSAAASAASAGG
ncbi:peptidylprolyl isomerase [Piscinibacter sakaiensis]|uniref:Periplasmic chaperone PpiD n=1 Tax=Piscinibacter sakaiensis TaxID=1547922 RepID=A0A0K8P2Y4_PISS1|nr:SurA N-terminal domain-containing protein [Piscinibacter sakaiensis]GAP37037.1 peptidyl-prolyl cis-trans isomerase PpiD [Piscinibacter sakaiensis]